MRKKEKIIIIYCLKKMFKISFDLFSKLCNVEISLVKSASAVLLLFFHQFSK